MKVLLRLEQTEFRAIIGLLEQSDYRFYECPVTNQAIRELIIDLYNMMHRRITTLRPSKNPLTLTVPRAWVLYEMLMSMKFSEDYMRNLQRRVINAIDQQIKSITPLNNLPQKLLANG